MKNDEGQPMKQQLRYKLMLAELVDTYLQDGWNLYGSPILVGGTVFQAITKVES